MINQWNRLQHASCISCPLTTDSPIEVAGIEIRGAAWWLCQRYTEALPSTLILISLKSISLRAGYMLHGVLGRSCPVVLPLICFFPQSMQELFISNNLGIANIRVGIGELETMRRLSSNCCLSLLNVPAVSQLAREHLWECEEAGDRLTGTGEGSPDVGGGTNGWCGLRAGLAHPGWMQRTLHMLVQSFSPAMATPPPPPCAVCKISLPANLQGVININLRSPKVGLKTSDVK